MARGTTDLNLGPTELCRANELQEYALRNLGRLGCPLDSERSIQVN